MTHYAISNDLDEKFTSYSKTVAEHNGLKNHKL